MTSWEIFLGVLLGLLVNETCEVSPWLAKKLVRRAAYLQLRDPKEAAGRAEELTGLINDRPGKLFKLATAVAFRASGVVVASRYAINGWVRTISTRVEKLSVAKSLREAMPAVFLALLALAAPNVSTRWKRQRQLRAILEYYRSMPEEGPGSLAELREQTRKSVMANIR
ncbi:hypothetical protein ACIBH1_37915 [Nonomuraea sp. NPDC050663]|uniref:hypothetical protein n=1 Tax=Nonomuraea sp. NPDC050663 TaxID=3364370 RepID=UPI0037B98BC5